MHAQRCKSAPDTQTVRTYKVECSQFLFDFAAERRSQWRPGAIESTETGEKICFCALLLLSELFGWSMCSFGEWRGGRQINIS